MYTQTVHPYTHITHTHTSHTHTHTHDRHHTHIPQTFYNHITHTEHTPNAHDTLTHTDITSCYNDLGHSFSACCLNSVNVSEQRGFWEQP